MPQFDFTTYSSQIFWFSICFATLYFAAHFIILPRITEILKNRKSVIDKDLSLSKDLEESISKIRSKSEDLRSKASKEYKAKIEEVTKDASSKKDKEVTALKEKIEKMTQKSRKEIKDFVANSQKDNAKTIQNLSKVIKNKIFN